jgi:hypothetical protein
MERSEIVKVLRERDPFKFIIYSGRIGEQTPQINSENVESNRER